MARSKGTHTVVTANLTDDGAPVYLTSERNWTRKLVEAHATTQDAEVESLLAHAAGQERMVCDAYAFKVVLGPLGPVATTARERIRGEGPTTPMRRPDAASRLSA